jgi:hypothetical protein
MEGLEARLLLSAAPVATPDFLLYHPVGSTAQPAATTSPTGLTPSLVRRAYGIDQVQFGSVVGDGSGQTIAIIDAYNDPNIASDLRMFDQQFGLPDANLVRVGQSGTSTLPRNDPSGPGDSWAMEISLDVEWAHAVAPKANLLLVEASSASDSDLLAAINTARNYSGVSVVSMSWGGAESASDQTTYDRYFTTPTGHTPITFIASAGDSGAYSNGSTSRGVEFPASSANVLAVGGTQLSVSSSGSYLSESGWGNGTASSSGGSGGGISRYVTQPSYQKGVVTQSTTYRTVPDVAFLADPASGVAVYDSWDSPSAPWVKVGGTSLAAPMWAGVIAMADQGRVLDGQKTLDGRSDTLPKLYALPASDFHDITTGNNGYAAGAGYDLVTGRGTPIVNLLAPALAGYSGSTTVTPMPTIGNLSASPSSVAAGAQITLTATGVMETAGTATISRVAFYRESNGVGGLQSAGDTSLGNGTLSNGVWTLSTSTAGLAPGDYTCYAVAYDSANVASNSASAALTVLAPASGNDSFAAGTVLVGTAASVTGTNVNATKESGEPLIAGNTGGKSVWYTWTAPSSGKVSLNTAGSNFDTMLEVFTGNSVSALTPIAANDDVSRYNLTSALTFTAVAGTTYHIAVDGYGGASGSIALNLSETAAPVNDAFANATQLVGRGITWNGTNIGATVETGEPYQLGMRGGASVWFTWTATTSGSVSVNTAGSSFDTVLAVYTGTSLSGLTTVAANDDASYGTLTSRVTFNAVAGTTYHIAVDGYYAAMGSIVLNLV